VWQQPQGILSTRGELEVMHRNASYRAKRMHPLWVEERKAKDIVNRDRTPIVSLVWMCIS
jgi:hypothetical protein